MPFLRSPRIRLIALVVATLVIVAGVTVAGLAGLASALYESLRGGGNSAAAGCEGTARVAERMRPFARGEVAAANVAAKPTPLPELAFDGPQGRRLTLADFRGRILVVNLWATWCAPCKQEMPALDRLEARLGGPDFAVVAINVDTRNLDKPRAWLEEAGIRQLVYYGDPQAKTFQTLRQAGRAVGMPTTFVLDRQGCALATVNGAAEWAGEDALALIRAASGS